MTFRNNTRKENVGRNSNRELFKRARHNKKEVEG